MANRVFRGLPIDLDAVTPGTYALVRVEPSAGGDHYRLQPEYQRTNQSKEARERGWCGSTDGVSVHACGCVEAYTDARGRLMLRSVPDNSLWESADGEDEDAGVEGGAS